MNATLRQSPDIEDILAAFLLRHAASPIDKLTDAIRAAVQQGNGVWMEPNPAGVDRPRQATHLFEITLFGITSTGFTATVAAQNWRTVATRIAEAYCNDSDLPDGEIDF